MSISSQKEGSFYNNKIMAVSVLLLIIAGLAYLVYATAGRVVEIKFVNITNGTYTSDGTLPINITFNTTTSSSTNLTILNTSINVTLRLNGVHIRYYNFTNMTCNYGESGIVMNGTMVCNVTTTGLPSNGTYEIRAYAADNDTSPNSATSTINFTLYTHTPKVTSVTIVNASGPNVVKGGTYNFTITFDRRMSERPEVNISLYNASSGMLQDAVAGLLNLTQKGFANNTDGTATWSGTAAFEGKTGGAYDGPFNVNISGAQDAAHNPMRANHSVIFTFDSVAPWVSLITANKTNQSTLNLQYNFSDNLSSTAYCRLFINGTVNATNASISNETNTNITMNSGITDGVYLWMVECNDTAGNRGNATEGYLNQIVNIDRTAPTIPASSMSPLDGHYINYSHQKPIIIRAEGITDALTGINKSSNGVWITVNTSSIANPMNFTYFTTYKINSTPESNLLNLNLSLNFSAALGVTTILENQAIMYTVYVVDYAGNLQSTSATFYLDNTPPTVGAPSLDASSYVQGANFTMTVQVNDTAAGVNRTTISLHINVTNVTGGSGIAVGNVTTGNAMVCSGANPSASRTCIFAYNTTGLPKGDHKLNGTIYGWDATDGMVNVGNRTISLAFTVTDAGAPTFHTAVIAETTRIVNNIPASVKFNVSVNDSSGISWVWATYSSQNTTGGACTFHRDGGVTTTNFRAFGNCTIKANSTGLNVSNNVLTVTIHVNDTTGSSSTAEYYLPIENELVNVSAFTAPTKIYLNQTIIINATVFSWNGTPRVWFNMTNGTNGLNQHVLLDTECLAVDPWSRLYYCANTTMTNGGVAEPAVVLYKGNTTTISIVNASYEGTGENDTTLPSAITTTVYSIKSINPSLPNTTKVIFLDSGVNTTAATAVNVSNTTQRIQITDDTYLNKTVITLNNIDVGTIFNFTFDRVSVNSSGGKNAGNGTNWTVIQTSLDAGVATLLAAQVIQPRINNLSTGFTGSTIAFNCTNLGVTCSATTRVYQADFNMTLNRTVGSWTVITDANTAWSSPILTVNVSSFSIFALATPVTTTTAAAVAVAAASSGGGGGGGISFKSTAASKTQVWTSLKKGAIALMNIANPDIAFSQVRFTSQNAVEKGELTVTTLDAKPAEAGDAAKVVYKYLQVTMKKITDADVGDASIQFKVSKEWLAKNGVKKEDIVLLRYADGKWNELATTLLKEDGEIYYKATTSGFSYFAVGVKEGAEVTPPAEEAVTPPAEEAVTPPAEEAVTTPPTEAKKMPWAGVLIAAIVIVLGLIIFLATRKKKV